MKHKRYAEKDIMSFFFTNFLDNFGQKQFYVIFKRYKLVKEVFFFIDQRDRWGRCYGFVCFGVCRTREHLNNNCTRYALGGKKCM